MKKKNTCENKQDDVGRPRDVFLDENYVFFFNFAFAPCHGERKNVFFLNFKIQAKNEKARYSGSDLFTL
jgi:hypothetical protein